ncbi:MAG: FG-GAP-like repeat-containing protein, partial [Myxococcota bacterium]
MRFGFGSGGLLILGLAGGFIACGDSQFAVSTGSGGGQTGGGGAAPANAGTGGAGGEGGEGLFPPDCATGTVCGAGDCCEGSEQCVLGVCLAACASGVRCGADLALCCDAGDVCVADACVVPGAPCQDWADCEEGEFCEPTLDQCLPQPGDDICEYEPVVGTLTPAVEWSWTSTTIQPSAVQVINAPIVGDLDQDGTPDVVIVTSNNYSSSGPGYLRALDGATGAEKWGASADVYAAGNEVNPRGTPALGDIDGDGRPEIVSPRSGGGLIAFDDDGSFKWASTQADGVTPYVTSMASITVAIADFEGDGTPEIAAGGVVFEADGSLRFDQGVFSGSNNGNYGAVSIVADLDGQGDQELVTGRRAFRADGTVYWDNGLVDGYPAIADLDLDGTPEVVVVAGGTVRVQDPTTGAVLASLAMPAAGAGGPPTIANFDPDPEPEIASANGGAYAVFGYASSPAPALTLQWSRPTQDLSSNRTGSSVFDFEGDGIAEVVYGDECYFRIYSGPDGTVLQEIESSSATIHEYPVVVDVDGD